MTLVATLLLALVLVAGRAALPSYLKSHVNRTLDESPDYDGRIGSVDVHLFRVFFGNSPRSTRGM